MNIFRVFSRAITAASLSVVLLASLAMAQSTTPPKLAQVSVGKDGTTLAVLTDRRIVVLQDNQWKYLDGQLVQISVGGYNNVWGINHYNELSYLTSNGWQVRPGFYSAVAAAADGTVVVLDLAGRVLQKTAADTNFVPVPGTLTFRKIALGRRDRLYGLTINGDLYKYKADTNAWRKVKGRFKDLAVTFDGLVSVKDYADVPFIRTDSAVEQELAAKPVTPQTDWVSYMPVSIPPGSLTFAVSATKSAAIDLTGQPLIITSSLVTVQENRSVPNGVIYSASEYATEAAAITLAECIPVDNNTSLELHLASSTTTASRNVLPNFRCKTGKFSRITLPTNPQTQRTSSLDAALKMAVSAQAEIQRQQAQENNTAPCKANSTFGASSARSWVQFNLPPAPANTVINIPGGAHNNYVFPACNRVWWDNLRFQCRQGNWALLSGRFDADGACHGWVTPSAYLTYGNR